jgi:hypothetical protein
MADAQDSSATNGTAAATAATAGRDPSGFLNEILHRPVTVKLNSGVVYKGSSCWDDTNLDVKRNGDLASGKRSK